MADTDNIILSNNPADAGTLSGVLRSNFNKNMQDIDGQLPAQVIAYDRATNRATVRPLITRLTSDGQPVERGSIASVPVLALGGGDFYINFPLKPGDRGWIEASDRDISLFMQANRVAKPNSLRLHSFSDGRFIPDVMSAYEYDGADDGKLVIASKDGKTKITLGDGEIKMIADMIDINGTRFQPGGKLEASEANISGIAFSQHIHDAPDGPTGVPR